MQLDSILVYLKDLIWSMPLLLLLLGTGLYLTVALKGVQFYYSIFAIKQLFAQQKSNAKGDITPFQALMTTLAGAIGTGTIVGVATALTIGGPGAIFWMWVTALLSMATKYSESLLAVKYRRVDKLGEMIGGPMYYIEKGLKLKPLALFFAFFGVLSALSTGNLVQANSISDAVTSVLIVDKLLIGVILFVLTTLVIFFGVKVIGKVASILVPIMAAVYLFASLYILFKCSPVLLDALKTILKDAWGIKSIFGGTISTSLIISLQTGVSRSVFSNEAGLGISSIAAAAAVTDSPCRQAMINMIGALVSTVILCTMTALVIMVSGVLDLSAISGSVVTGAPLAIEAFDKQITGGAYIVSIGLIFFAYTTLIAWAYYGEKCFEYIFGEKYIILYRALYALIVIPGAILNVDTVWHFADINNGLMAIPNLIALIFLTREVAQDTEKFTSKN